MKKLLAYKTETIWETKSVLLFIFLLTTISINKSNAQSFSLENENNPNYTSFYFGLGIGMDYGAIGIKAEFLPSKYVGIFAGAGYALIDPAFNAGVSAKLLPDNKFCPTITAMYGYNGVIVKKDFYGSTMASSKIYYGVTIGAGGEIKIGKKNQNKFGFGVLVPFRNSEFHNDYNILKQAGHKFQPDILPVAFSVGVNFGLVGKTHKK